MIEGNETKCDTCGKTLALGEHPFCPHGIGGNARIHDDIPGGLVLENLGPHPVRVYSMTEYHKICKERGLQPKERFSPLPGTDIDPAGIPNPAGYVDAYTLEAGASIIRRNGQKAKPFDAIESGVLRNLTSEVHTKEEAIRAAHTGKK